MISQPPPLATPALVPTGFPDAAHAHNTRPAASRRYREHDEVRHSYPTRQQRQMAHEWVLLNRDPAAAAVLARWGAKQKALAGLRRPGDVLDRVDGAGPTERDAILATLIELFHDGSALAGRIVLQAMMPKLSGYAWRVRAADEPCTEERFQRVVCDFWEVLCDYPLHRRRHRVAANLALDTLNRLTRSARVGEVAVDPTELSLLVDAAATSGVDVPDPEQVDPDWGLNELLTWALRAGLVGPDDARLLLGVYSDRERLDRGQTGFRAVSAGGVSAQALRQRAHRVRTRLTAAVREAQARDSAWVEHA